MEFEDITYFLTKLAKIAVHLTIFITVEYRPDSVHSVDIPKVNIITKLGLED